RRGGSKVSEELRACAREILPFDASGASGQVWCPAVQRLNQGYEPRHQVARKHQAGDERGADDAENDLGETRQQDRVGLVRVESSRDADKGNRVAGEQKSVGREAA